MKLICPECGLVDLDGTDRCPTCGMTALDDDNPEHRSAIDEAISLGRQRLRPNWAIGAILVSVGVGFLIGTWVGKSPEVGELVVYPFVIATAVVVELIAMARLTPAWRAAIASHRGASGDRALRRARLTSTTAIAMAICASFVVVASVVGLDALAFQRDDLTTRPWRVVTSAFTHAGPMHLAGNMIALAVFGFAIDLRVGRLATAAILAVAAVGGAVAHALTSTVPAVGFSAAIYGLIGATLALMPTRPTMLIMQGIAIPMPTWLWTLFAIPLFTFTAWVDQRSHVAWVAHLGGFVAGFVVALPMRYLRPTPSFAHAEELRRRPSSARRAGDQGRVACGMVPAPQ